MSDKEHSISCAIFQRSQARLLLKNKYILLMGDSVQRGMYKDLVALCNDGHIMTDEEKRAKGEDSYRGDQCLNVSDLTNNTNFTEVRQYVGYKPLTTTEKRDDSAGAFNWSNSILIRFVFITRAWNDYVRQALEIVTDDFFPDVICINSTFWDISRWDESGNDLDRNGKPFYPALEQNVKKLTQYINEREMIALRGNKIENPCLKIWRSAMPIGTNAAGGLMKKELDFGSESYREDIARSNLNLKPIIENAGWDLLDAQFWFRSVQDDYREDDGIHWSAVAHRYLSNIFLTHISESWGYGWPTYPVRNGDEDFGKDKDGKPLPGLNWSELRTSVKEFTEQLTFNAKEHYSKHHKNDNRTSSTFY